MRHSDFVHLHNHTQYSLLDGACKIPDFVEKASRHKMPAVAITDHGNMFGAIEFYNAAHAQGIKPVVGCELYVAPGSRFEKQTRGVKDASYHLTVLVKDETGYRNLIKLVSNGYLEGFYYKPRVDKELLSECSAGLIGMSGCMKSEAANLLLSGQQDSADRALGEYADIFGKENFYLELHDHGIKEEGKITEFYLDARNRLGLNVVATNDVHYLSKELATAHEVLLCIQTQTTMADPNRMRLSTDQFYMKSPEEMKALFAHCPDAIKNTLAIAESCNLELSFGKVHLPKFDPPSGITPHEFLRKLAHEGMKRRFAEPDQMRVDRLEHELRIIDDTGYTSYFLIVWDFVTFARQKNIPVGPGRGSAAGSLVAYCLGITDLDPVRYRLIFERFLNPDRGSMPDIDIDFCYERRDEVIRYVTSKYGMNHVAQIITFGTMAARAVIRDVGRATGMSYSEVDRIAKLVPAELNMTLKRALEIEPELRKLKEADKRVLEILEISSALEGLTRHASTHAAGIVISRDPLSNYCPVYRVGDGQITTQYAMESLEKIGLLKMDFLGLKTLTVIDQTVKIVEKVRNEKVDISQIPLDDEQTFALLKKGGGIGIFQLESSGMRDLLRKLQPAVLEDIIALLALYRPGPLGSGLVDDFIERKHGKVPIKYIHSMLAPILEETYGVILYQEQIMATGIELAGLSFGQADSIMRGIGKKQPEKMEELRDAFIKGAVEKGIKKTAAEEIFKQVSHFAGYGFNKAHATAYALVAYRTAYLKTNYPVEFMAALLTSERDNTDKIVLYVEEAKKMGIAVLPPDVNESYSDFTVTGGSIRFGLAAVKNVGRSAVEHIVKARKEHGGFTSLHGFCDHVDLRAVNRKVIESLIKCGAFDSLKLFRSQLMAALDRAMEAATALQKDRQSGQLLFFDEFESQPGFKRQAEEVPDIEEWHENQLLAYEKELLGFYVTGHPLARYEKLIKTFATGRTSTLIEQGDGSLVRLGGVITKIKEHTTKRGDKMAFFTLEDLEGMVEAVALPDVYEKSAGLLVLDGIIFVQGKIQISEQAVTLKAAEVISPSQITQKLTREIVLLVSETADEEVLNSVNRVIKGHTGRIPVFIRFNSNGENGRRIRVKSVAGVDGNEDFISEIEKILGDNSIRVLLTNGA